jgi:hypothetical protein
VARLKSGNSFDLFNTRLDATALNNNLDFNLRLGDQNNRDKYVLGGLLRQPSAGTINLSLKPGNLILNYEPWTVSPNNSITITPQQVLANRSTATGLTKHRWQWYTAIKCKLHQLSLIHHYRFCKIRFVIG